jgi:hypothetical protein
LQGETGDSRSKDAFQVGAGVRKSKDAFQIGAGDCRSKGAFQKYVGAGDCRSKDAFQKYVGAGDCSSKDAFQIGAGAGMFVMCYLNSLKTVIGPPEGVRRWCGGARSTFVWAFQAGGEDCRSRRMQEQVSVAGRSRSKRLQEQGCVAGRNRR